MKVPGFDQRIGRTIEAMAAILPWKKRHTGSTRSEILECPIWAGKLHVAIAGRRGHTRAKCETPDCVEWIE